jgi:hypothetical protein
VLCEVAKLGWFFILITKIGLLALAYCRPAATTRRGASRARPPSGGRTTVERACFGCVLLVTHHHNLNSEF